MPGMVPGVQEESIYDSTVGIGKMKRSKAFVIFFKDLHVWSVGSFFNLKWQWPAEYIKPLSAALKRKNDMVNRADYLSGELKLVTLHFDGTMVTRVTNGKNDFKGKLLSAASGNVVYSKIDVRNGAIGIVPEDMARVAVSSEFPVYEVNLSCAVPQYVKLLFRTQYFRQAINSMISGTSGRKRVQPSQLEDIEVPLPPLPIQRAIVEKWRNAQEEIKFVEKKIEKNKVELDGRFFSDIGLKQRTQSTPLKHFIVWWHDFVRWSVSYNQTVLSSIDISRGKFPIVDIGSVVEMIQYGTSEKANSNASGTPIIRMNNIVNGVLDLSNLKYIQLPASEKEKLLLKDGDILFNRTNSKVLVGKCAVYHENGEHVFASYLIRVRANLSIIDPDFLTYVINSPIGRQQINALSRQIIGQANINSVELRSIQIPLPPVVVQHEILRHVEKSRTENAHGREAAERKSLEIKTEIEALILGTKKIEAA